MEADGVTKVYITSGDECAWLIFPERTSYESRLRGVAVREVLDRADFHAVNSESFKVKEDGSWGEQVQDEWGVFPKPDGDLFVVDRKGWTHTERYSNLAKILEDLTGKTGLTILVS